MRRVATLFALLLLVFAAPVMAQTATVVDSTATSITIRYDNLGPVVYHAQLLQGETGFPQTVISDIRFPSGVTPVPRDPPPPGSWWAPSRADTFYWQLQGTLASRSSQFSVVDIDGFDTSSSTVTSLHNAGQHAVCYLSVGTWEDWRPDAGSFPASVKGNGNGWPGEKWLDIRSSALMPIMDARLDMCKSKGFDAVEFDNQDGYQNSTGFPLTASDQATYNTWLAGEAHARGLAAVLKNDVDQVSQLQSAYDAALNEQCAQYSECGAYKAFVDAGKAVWQVEYGTKNATRCTQATAAGRRAYYAGTSLSGSSRWDPC